MSAKLFTKEDLIDELGPAPTIEATAKFLREPVHSVYRKLYREELESLPGLGVTKISLASLLKYLNGGKAHVAGTSRNPNGRRGKKAELDVQ
jgi:hypothetical protein